ncbi:Uncharacterised protein [Enterobacter hormaechei]|uniref:hypothetical protein n=1 Tax=Enterobacter hormaechei TaxID=158836 RepID=UPI000DFB8F80|nr:hypothetical protein [Enterobacter hormaechei]STP90559.1 Uncharacterised protein [Enterobacter hormaechei]
MSTFTKEQLIEKLQHRISVASGFPESEKAQMDLELARIALASLEAEPAIHRWRRVTAEPYGPYPWHYGNFICFSKPVDGIEDEYYYAAPPAPVSVPDERYQHLSELYHAQEKRLFKLAQRIKGASFDKYAYSPSQAIDVLESAIFGEREDECRAAMLQGADGTLTNEGTIPVTQFNPVADLYGLTSPTGSETSFTFDAVEARDFIDGGWSCQEYVELGRFQEAVSGNSPVIPDGWVAVPVEPTIAILDEFDSIIDYGAEDSKDAWSRLLAAAWIKSLPAAPQQEVESQIRKGKTVAREEWELGRG